jgi:hypothetical protein
VNGHPVSASPSPQRRPSAPAGGQVLPRP